MKILPPAASTAFWGSFLTSRLTYLTNSTVIFCRSCNADFLCLRVSSLSFSIVALVPYLRSVSSELSKLFCLFSSAMRASFAANSESVGRLCEIGGVTPHCFCVAAMIQSYLPSVRMSSEDRGASCRLEMARGVRPQDKGETRFCISNPTWPTPMSAATCRPRTAIGCVAK